MALPGPLLLLAALALRWAHGEIPTVHLIDQEGPILEGSSVTLECLTDEAGADMSQFTFQKYSPWLHSWVSLDNPDRLRCWFFDVNVTRADGRLLLAIGALQSWHAGAYRCVAANGTGNASASAELSLRVEYLRSVFVTRAHTWCGTVGDSVAVMEGEDVELQCSADASQPPEYEWSRQGADWVVASSALSLPHVSREQAGTYECRAQHPSLPHLARSRAVRLDVQGPQSSYQLEPGLGLSTPVLLLAVGLPALLLLLLVLGLSVLVLRRRQAAKIPAGEEPGQRTPIYKGSLESVPSVAGDQQPLVL
ncbi:cell surface glycoprotein MUC18-like [Mauremys reevesii]|uniref:cell surface glycoprotein MUC18-like n=1 Tax=Mauremys reevesii TaxID=260615 RepID=UPI00193FA770|nr:cell surface glycoprotein MUC18-like [Mauremys reevesii]